MGLLLQRNEFETETEKWQWRINGNDMRRFSDKIL